MIQVLVHPVTFAVHPVTFAECRTCLASFAVTVALCSSTIISHGCNKPTVYPCPTSHASAGEQTRVTVWYPPLTEDQKCAADCPLKYLRVKENLWMDIRFIDSEIALPVRAHCDLLTVQLLCMFSVTSLS